MNPALHSNETFCRISQNNPHVWFLAGKFGGKLVENFGGSQIRKCTIPHEKAILFPIINCVYSFADEPSITTESALEELCKREIDDIVHFNASLDGETFDIQRYRIRTPCFTVQLPPDNCLKELAGTTKIASDGYWLFIEALPIGSHLLESFGSCQAGKIKIECTFQLVIE